LGGQLACLFAAARPGEVSGLVLIASCSVYHRAWSFPGNLALLGLQQLARLSALALGYFPGTRVGFAGREARRLMADWARQGLTGRYRVARSERDFEALLRALELPLLAMSFTDDPYCTQAATAHLLGKMPAAEATHLHRSPKQLGAARLGHFSWVKQAELLVPPIGEWLPGPSPRKLSATAT
ncbi:MAG: alpha/beta hydrolase, partial [bacterium]|nr:alpha/beta hydrolase [bacterium]